MNLLAIVITLIVVGVLLWLEETYIPMDATIKKLIRIVVIIVTVIWLLQVLGVWGYLSNVGVNRLSK
jgi:hypothetical protein